MDLTPRPLGPKSDDTLRLVSWNINSVRARIHHVEHLIKNFEPDVICLQETKAMNDVFPAKVFQKLGYEYRALHGQKSHHGVATLSRINHRNEAKINWCDKGDARHVQVDVGGFELHNFYVPAGGDEPDVTINEKFAHKMQFLAEMEAWARTLNKPTIMLGDLNIAPLEHDVWSHKALLKVVSHTPIEVEAMDRIFKAHDWVDAVRHFYDDDNTKLYTWWSYRARDWKAANKGRRLYHIWVSSSLKAALKDVSIATNLRDLEKPSDHAPIILDLDKSKLP